MALALAKWKVDVSSNLGDDLSTAERTLLEVAAGDMALLATADAWLRENPGRGPEPPQADVRPARA
jgi:hypothetical protein